MEGKIDGKKKILIVDDQTVNLGFLEKHFSKMGFVVEKAEDGVEALERLESFFPDVILLDNIMPRMTGHELVKILKNNPKYNKIPIVIFSASDNPGEKADCLALGVEDYIIKPINLSNLQERIMAVVNREE